MEGPWLDKPFMSSDLGCLQNWLHAHRRADEGSLACSGAARSSWDRLCTAQMHKDSKKKCSPQRPSRPTLLRTQLRNEHREPLRQPSQTDFYLLASSSSLLPLRLLAFLHLGLYQPHSTNTNTCINSPTNASKSQGAARDSYHGAPGGAGKPGSEEPLQEHLPRHGVRPGTRCPGRVSQQLPQPLLRLLPFKGATWTKRSGTAIHRGP